MVTGEKAIIGVGAADHRAGMGLHGAVAGFGTTDLEHGEGFPTLEIFDEDEDD